VYEPVLGAVAVMFSVSSWPVPWIARLSVEVAVVMFMVPAARKGADVPAVSSTTYRLQVPWGRWP